MKIGIIDYGAGNTRSVQNALDRLGVAYVLTDSVEILDDCDRIIFPGVGSAGMAMSELQKRDLIDWTRNCAKPFLDICLGMQLLFDSSEEGNVDCLGIISGKVLKFDQKKCSKIPHMGWNLVRECSEENVLMRKCVDVLMNEYFYFVHSYFVPVGEFTTGICRYENQEFSAMVRKGNFWGMQFHPEKSGEEGECLLLNFLNTPSISASKGEKNYE